MSLDAATAHEARRGRILVAGGPTSQSRELAEVVRRFGHHVSVEVKGWTGTDHEPPILADLDAVLILAEERDASWAGRLRKIQREAVAPPLVVLGPADGPSWRQRALQSGAFLCASLEAPPEDLQSLLWATIRYRSLEKEINLLRVECERICLGLLKSYGHTAASLKDSTEEVEALQANLQDIRNQIIRAFV
jgi:hypothetical protein